MKKQNKKIETIITKYIDNDYKGNLSKFEREHIFYDLKKMINEKYNQEILMDMYYYFSVYEKILNFARTGNLTTSKYWIDKISKKQKELSEDIKSPLDLLYIPAVAYYEYKINNKEKALALLDNELRLVKEYLSNQNVLRVEHLLEQSINKIRIYWTFNEYDNFKIYSQKLLLFVLANVKNDNIFNSENIHELKNNDFDNYLVFLEYAINSILFKIITSVNFSKTKKYEFIFDIFKPILKQSKLLAFENKFLAIKYFLDNKEDRFQESIIKSLEEKEIFPNSLQYFLLSLYFDNTVDKKNHKKELFNLYFKKILGLNFEINE